MKPRFFIDNNESFKAQLRINKTNKDRSHRKQMLVAVVVSFIIGLLMGLIG